MEDKSRSDAVLPSTDGGGSAGRVHEIELGGLGSGVTLRSGKVLRGAPSQPPSQISDTETLPDTDTVAKLVADSDVTKAKQISQQRLTRAATFHLLQLQLQVTEKNNLLQ